MADIALESQPPAGRRPRLRLGEWLRRNPVTLKELRSRMRGRRAFVVLTVHVLLLSAVVSLVYGAYTATNRTFSRPGDLQALGKIIFSLVVGFQLLTMCFISPSLTVGAISAERERQTFDLLRTTLLSARALVLGKLMSALSFTFLLMLAAIPIESLAFLFGGVTIEEVLISSLMLIVTALTFSSIGLFFSSFTRRTMASTALANGTTVLLVIGLPILLVVMLSIMSPVIYGFGGSVDPNLQARLLAVQWLMISISPIPSAIATEAMLASGQGTFTTTMPIYGGSTLQLIAPWITYAIIYSAISLILIILSIRFVRRPEK